MRTRNTRLAHGTSLIRISNLWHSYGAHVALSGISLEIREGEILGILGPNGGGKSTLFKILSTAMLPSDGDASIAGQSVRESPDRVRESIGVVFQSFGLDKKLTVHENLRCQGNLYFMQGEMLEERIGSLLASFGLSERAKELVGTLSGGLQRRVEIAKGVLHSPKVLLLDEPSTGLDPSARLDLWRFLEHCRKEEHTTIVLTTHLAEEADRCDRIAILDRGTVAALGRPEDLRNSIGGDVLLVSSKKVSQLKAKLLRQFKLHTTVVGNELMMEVPAGHRFIPKLIRTFPNLVSSVTLRKPSLEDVFVHATGHTLEANDTAGERS